MVEDNEGYRYPVVDAETCTDCGACEAVCPLLSEKIIKKNPIKNRSTRF